MSFLLLIIPVLTIAVCCLTVGVFGVAVIVAWDKGDQNAFIASLLAIVAILAMMLLPVSDIRGLFR